MADPGVFRTSAFGGFNKKDVYDFFDGLKTESNSQIDDYKKRLLELMNKYDELEASVTQRDEKINKMTDELNNTQAQRDELQQLKEQNAELNQKLAKASEDESYKSRCDQLAHKVVKSQSEIMQLKSALENEKNRHLELENTINSLSNLDFNSLDSKIGALSSLADLFDMLSNVKDILSTAQNKQTEN